MRLPLVLSLVGQFIRPFAWAFLPPVALALYDHQWLVAAHFAFATLATLLAGTVLGWTSHARPRVLRSEALAVVALTWLAVALLSAVPYALGGLRPVDAVFEAMSGLTTTGATILTDFHAHGRAFFLWRAMTQWFGGVGVIALFIVVLPQLGIAGRQMFFAEASHAPSDAVSPQIRTGARRLWVLYAALTVTVILLLSFAGMSLYDAVVHALTTMSAGGFSPHPGSIGGYANASVEWILVVFMILAGTSFTLQYKVFTGNVLEFFRDGEFRFYLLSALLGAGGIALLLSGGLPGEEHLRAAAFQVASLISSTGYASVDYNLWADDSRAVLIAVMLVSGCAGSAAGGPKAIRMLLVGKQLLLEMRKVIHPQAVLPLRYKGQRVPDDIIRAVYSLVTFYMAGYLLLGLTLVVMGNDLLTGFSAALACLGNIGPGLGPVGPMGSYAGFSDAAKVVLVAAMWIGRLEIVTVVALLHRDVLSGLRLRPGGSRTG